VAREETEAHELVDRPRPDVRRRDVADVVRVEAEERPEIRVPEVLLGAREPLAAQALEVDPLLPVDAHRPEAAHRHGVRPSSSRMARATVSAVGTVSSSSTGENGTGTSRAPILRTGASRS